MVDYISPKAGLLSFDFNMRGKNNMHKVILNMQDKDLQWLFSPIHIKEVFNEFVKIHKEENQNPISIQIDGKDK